MSLFTNKTLLITGGTGSFGNAVLNRFLATDIGEIRIFSRDEKKQDDMRHEFQAKMPEVADKIKFYIGDVRDLDGIIEQYLATVKPMHNQYVEPTKAYADIIINGGLNDRAYDLVKNKIQSILRKGEKKG